MKLRICALFLTAVILLGGVYISADSVSAYTSATKTPNAVMTLKNLGTNRAVQQFYFYNDANGDRYVFATQRVKADTYLSRCKVSADGLTATCLDYVVLANYGHGEALAVYDYEGQPYVYVVGNTITDETDDLYTSTYWARNFSRFKYVPDSTQATGARIADEKKLTNFINATSSGSSIYSGARIYRMAFSASPNSDRIMFWLKFKNGSTYKEFLCCYKFSALNAALSASSGSVSMANMGSHQLAKISYDGNLPNGSMQGMGLDGTGTLYFSGGSNQQTPTIHKYSYTSSSITLKEVWTVPSKANVEIETAYMLNGSFYCIFIDDETSNGKKNNTKIYTLDDYTVTTMHANLKYAVKGLPSSYAVQSFAFSTDMKQLYISQRVGTDTYISRCSLNGNVARVLDYAVLTGAGIGESLEVDQSVAGKTYLWAGGAPVYGSDYYATTLLRLEYKVDASSASGASVVSTKVTDLAYANATATAMDTTGVKRVAVSMTNETDNRLVVRTQFVSGDIYYTVYVTSTLNAAITAAGSSYSLKNASSIVKSNFCLNKQPNSSFQGFDADGVGTDAKFMYMVGGSSTKMQLPLIYKYLYTNGGNATLKNVYRISNTMLTVQGIKIYGGNMYVIVQPHSDNKNSTTIRMLSTTYVADPALYESYKLQLANTAGVSITNGYIKDAAKGTTVSELLKSFSNVNTVRVVKDGKVLSGSDILTTACTVQSIDYSGAVSDSADIAIIGDINCDGMINASDYIVLRSYFVYALKFDDCVSVAADLSDDASVNALDYIALKNRLKG